MTNIPPGIADQAREEFATTGTFSDSTLTAVADIVKADHPHLRGAAPASFDWLALVKQILTILLGLFPAGPPKQPGT